MTTPSGPLSRMEKIQILMEEYKTLRAEILQHHSSGFQLYGVAGSAAVAVTVLAAAYSVIAGMILFFFFPLLLMIVARNSDFSVREAAFRLREIEHHVNELAEDNLLRWETERGGIWPEARKRRAEYILGPLTAAYAWTRELMRRTFSN
jgi:hypothetical protein